MTRVLAGLGVAAAVVGVLLGLPLAVAMTLTATTPAGALSIGLPSATSGENYGPKVPGSASPRVSAAAAEVVLRWANGHAGDAYRMGADGPHAWDCSSFARAAWARVGVRLPRVAQAQRDWLAAGHGTRIPPGREQPGDLIFWDSYLGPTTIGHVVLVHDPRRHSTIDARSTRLGVGHFTYHPDHHRYEIWRPTLPTHPPHHPFDSQVQP